MSDEKLTDDELELELVAAKGLVQLGAMYEHTKSGGNYIARDVALREDDLEPMVVYAKAGKRFSRPVVFVRPLVEFRDKFKRVGGK